MPDAPDNQPPTPVLSYASSTNKLICEPMRSGRFVVVGDKVSLPRRCVLCNTAAQDPPVHLNLYRKIGSFYYEGVGDLSLHARHTNVSFSLCRRHLRRRRWARAAIILLAITVLVACTIAIYAKSHQRDSLGDITCFLGVAGMLGVGIAAIIGTKGPRCHHFQGGYYYLEGFGPPFLQSFPQVPSSPNSK